MLIAILDFETTAADRSAALGHLDAVRDRVRAIPGNLAFRIYASRADESQVTVIHEWDGTASFDDYLRSETFARLGEVLRPLLTTAPVSRRFHAELLDAVA